VLRACAKYRTSLPIYLLSTQDELAHLDAIVRRISHKLSPSK